MTNKHFLFVSLGYPVSGYSSVIAELEALLAGISLKVLELFIDVTAMIPGFLLSTSSLLLMASSGFVVNIGFFCVCYDELQHGTCATNLGSVFVTVVAAEVFSFASSAKWTPWL